MKLAAMLLVLLISANPLASGQGTKKPDPCANAQTQAEMNICAGKKYQAADTELNQIYRKLVSMLDDAEKFQLKGAQNAWLKYCDANCEFVADQYKGGSIRPTISGLCLADMTKNRTAELIDQIKDRNQ